MRPLAVVTGASTGIGLHTAGQLAQSGYHVVLACRRAERKQEVLQSLHRQYGRDIDAEFAESDLASFSSVRAFASTLASRHDGLHLLVCNAGLNSASAPKEPELQLSADGVDILYQTNFLSHLLLTLLLMPMLRAARGGRVVNVSSVVHRKVQQLELRLSRQVRRPYRSLYSLSKFAQIAACEELHRRFGKGHGVAFHCVNPGGVASDIWRGYPAWQRPLLSAVLAGPETAAETIVEACTCEEGNAPAEPRYWNGYKLASRLSLFEWWSPFPARASLVESTPGSGARSAALTAEIWEDSIATLGAAGFKFDDHGSGQEPPVGSPQAA